MRTRAASSQTERVWNRYERASRCSSNYPKESWFQLAAALYLEKEDFDSAVPIFEELVTRFRKKQYWVQLSLIYSARGNYEQVVGSRWILRAGGRAGDPSDRRRSQHTFQRRADLRVHE